MRVGINTVPVIAGRDGERKFNYDCGEARFKPGQQANGSLSSRPGPPHVTRRQPRLLDGRYRFDSGTMQVRGSGEMCTHSEGRKK